jgi:hypothetical protein
MVTPLSDAISIEAIVRQAMADVARLATAGGARASLSQVADQVFWDLASELERQGVTKNVAADMFGMSLRTYHRRVQQVRQEQKLRRTVRDFVLEFVRARPAVSAHAVHQQFLRHPAEVVAGALNDLVHAGLLARKGWGENAVYSPLRRGQPVTEIRIASQAR